MALEFFTKAMEVAKELEATQGENISEAAKLIADAIEKGGILQAFGSGHSYAAALEICGRAGGFIPSKVIADPAGGIYESVEGVGKILAHRVQIKEHDVVVLISNSGRNPLAIELAQWVKAHGNKLIVVTALDISKASSSRHSSGTLLYQYADVILDNMSIHGDAALSVEGLETKVCGTSSFAGVLLLQQTIFEAVQILVKNGVKPPVYVSSNIDGGLEYNTKKEVEYSDRIFHM